MGSHRHKLSRQVPKDPVQRPDLGGRRRGPSQHPPRDCEARVRRDLRGKQIPGAHAIDAALISTQADTLPRLVARNPSSAPSAAPRRDTSASTVASGATSGAAGASESALA